MRMAHKSETPNEDEYGVVDDAVYAGHLAEVNKTRQVVATEDIFNERGVLLVKKGSPITPKTTQAIIAFKLTKPLQDTIAIATEINARNLFDDFMKLIEQDSSLKQIHARYNLHQLLERHCQEYDNFSLMRQKITVMSERLPDIYKRSLYSAWFGLLIAKEMHLSAREVTAIFLAALCHDIGMLHISPEILQNEGQLNPEQWRQMQAHVIISQKILIAIKELPPLIATAVLEHHERCDGTGYPFGKMNNELSLAGQVIALADTIVAIYFNRFEPERRGWRELIPVLQMNRHTFFYQNYETLVTVLRRSEIPQQLIVTGNNMPAFITALIEKNSQINQVVNQIKEPLLSMGFTHDDRKLHAIQNVFIQITAAVYGSGIFDGSLIAWLEEVKEKQLAESYSEMEDIFLMQEEVTFHLQRLARMSQVYFDTELNKILPQVVEALNICVNSVKIVEKN
jgi:HD-GYP domain-containing protein (c-di-GMP phosphodiesterase class II)